MSYSNTTSVSNSQWLFEIIVRSLKTGHLKIYNVFCDFPQSFPKGTFVDSKLKVLVSVSQKKRECRKQFVLQHKQWQILVYSRYRRQSHIHSSTSKNALLFYEQDAHLDIFSLGLNNRRVIRCFPFLLVSILDEVKLPLSSFLRS